MMKANKLRLGIFFVVTMTFFLAVMIWLTGGFGGEKTVPYVCYFDWSVSGLSQGSEVMYNGLPIGQVRTISLAPDGRLVQVHIELAPAFVVDSEITAALLTAGITGSQKIDLSRYEEGEPRYFREEDLDFTPPYQVIPVAPGTMQKLSRGVDRMVEIMDIIDFQALNDELMNMLVNINRLLDAAEVEILMECLVSNSRNLDSLMIAYTRLGRNADLLVTQVRLQLPELSADAERLMESLAEFTSVLRILTVKAENSLEPLTGFVREAGELLPVLREGLDDIFSPPRREAMW